MCTSCVRMSSCKQTRKDLCFWDSGRIIETGVRFGSCCTRATGCANPPPVACATVPSQLLTCFAYRLFSAHLLLQEFLVCIVLSLIFEVIVVVSVESAVGSDVPDPHRSFPSPVFCRVCRYVSNNWSGGHLGRLCFPGVLRQSCLHPPQRFGQIPRLPCGRNGGS